MSGYDVPPQHVEQANADRVREAQEFQQRQIDAQDAAREAQNAADERSRQLDEATRAQADQARWSSQQ